MVLGRLPAVRTESGRAGRPTRPGEDLLAVAESEVAARWAACAHRTQRLEDGRGLRVVFPGVSGGAQGPDFTGAVLEVGGDLVYGDVEVHVRESGWQAHGHGTDAAYGQVVLHVVAENDSGAAVTRGPRLRAIPILRLGNPAAKASPFVPPCAVACRRGLSPLDALERLGVRRLRAKAVRAGQLIESAGPGQALYYLLLETLGGPRNREPFADLARRMPLGALLERAGGEPDGRRRRILEAELRWAAASLVIRWAGYRPMASPLRRLELAAALVGRLWPAMGSEPDKPAGLLSTPPELPRLKGLGRAMRRELQINSVLPWQLAMGAPEPEVIRAWHAVSSPGTYGHLRSLERWLTADGARPFGSAGRLQGGLLLHRDYCTRGKCGRCPLS